MVRPKRRLVGIDAARGLALFGLMAIHLLPAWDEDTGEASWTWTLFSGDSAALFALLAGVGLALTSGGRHPHTGREMTADRTGLLVRAALIAVVGLWVGTLMSEDPPAYSILLYYGMFFLLAIPFLHLGPKALFVAAGAFGIVSPVLIQGLRASLPEFVSYNPTFTDLVTQPGATASQLLFTGTYPALPYMTYLLVGMGLGRLNLRKTDIKVRLLTVGLGITVLARITSYVLLYALGGYQRLLGSTAMSEHGLNDALVWGPDTSPTTGWWLMVGTPHTNTPLAIAASLGVSLAVLGLFLLIAPKIEAWMLPLAAMGGMTLTLYTAHLVALSFEVHYDQPYLWFMVHLAAAALFAVAWQRLWGQGPLERVVSTSVRSTRRLVRDKGSRSPDT